MASVNRSLNLTTSIGECSLSISGGRLSIILHLTDVNGKVYESVPHIINVDGSVINQSGEILYVNAPGSVVADLNALVSSISSYVDTAADDEKI